MSSRKFIVKNRKKRKILFSILFVMLFMITVGYSTLSTILHIGGNLEIAKGKCQVNGKLYNVLKCAVEDGLALEYTGAHQDSMDASKSTEKIYHWYAPSTAEGGTIASQVLEKNNVIFAGQCWQMIRTTDTGGVKMIYNGEAENNQCLDNRGNHIGYGGIYSLNIASNYWYGTDYTYDSTNKVFSISGITEQSTWNETTGPNLIGKYTCNETSVDGTCETLYLVESYINETEAHVLALNPFSHYSQFGRLPFNLGLSPLTDIGYMYGDEKKYSVLYPTNTQTFPIASFQVLYTTALNDSYLYSKTISYTENGYSLVDPILGSDIPEDSYDEYYTFGSSFKVSGTQPYYIIGAGSGNNYYSIILDVTKQLFDFNMMIGDSITDNGDGTFSLNNAISVTPTDWYNNYASYKEKYTCSDASIVTCTNPKYFVRTTINNYNYINAGNKITISKTRNGLNLSDTKTVTYDLWYKDYSTYSDYKYTCGDASITCTEDNLSMIIAYNENGYSYVSNHYYGSGVTWDGTNYTLIDPIEIENYKTMSNLSTHHYMCIEKGLKSCSNVAYLYNINTYQSIRYYYITLDNGLDNIDEIVNNAFTKNSNNSIIKSGVDAWYRHYLLKDYDEYIEDTIFCNDRSIQSLGGWNSNGGEIDDRFEFNNLSLKRDLSCANVTDQFSVFNNKAKLTYKVGLMSSPEKVLQTNSSLLKVGSGFWLISPEHIESSSYTRHVLSNGNNNNSFNGSVYPTANGLRPTVSLIPGIQYSYGDGSKEKPYYIGDVYSITNNSSIFKIEDKSPPGWEVKLENDDYAVTSFKLNGALVEGDSFVMPEEDVIITDIQYIPAYYSITNTDGNIIVPSSGRYHRMITLETKEYTILSFKLDGTLIEGNCFLMPSHDVVITDVEKIHQVTIESEHNPYLNGLDWVSYYDNTFEGATSITVELTYQTQGASYNCSDLVYLYDTLGSTTPYNNKKYCGSTLKTETLTINSNYLKIVFRTDDSGNNFYGFKAVITPNY